jgi:hypothetical protein
MAGEDTGHGKRAFRNNKPCALCYGWRGHHSRQRKQFSKSAGADSIELRGEDASKSISFKILSPAHCVTAGEDTDHGHKENEGGIKIVIVLTSTFSSLFIQP